MMNIFKWPLWWDNESSTQVQEHELFNCFNPWCIVFKHPWRISFYWKCIVICDHYFGSINNLISVQKLLNPCIWLGFPFKDLHVFVDSWCWCGLTLCICWQLMLMWVDLVYLLTVDVGWLDVFVIRQLMLM